MDNMFDIRPISQNYVNTKPEAVTPAAAINSENEEIKAQDTRSKSEDKLTVEEAAMVGTYGNVLDISEDGDTVSARPEALAALEDGIVMLKSEDNTEQTEGRSVQATNSEENSPANEQSSFAGVSESQMRTMYLKGDISSATYRRELEKRERLEEQINPEEDERTTQAQDRNNAFIANMTNIGATANKESVENDAYNEALKAGRTDIVMDIFNQGN